MGAGKQLPTWHKSTTSLQLAGLMAEARADCPAAATIILKQPLRTSEVAECAWLAGGALQGVQQGHERLHCPSISPAVY